MAQLVEHILGKDEVISSNLISSSKQPRGFILGALAFFRGCFSSSENFLKKSKKFQKRY